MRIFAITNVVVTQSHSVSFIYSCLYSLHKDKLPNLWIPSTRPRCVFYNLLMLDSRQFGPNGACYGRGGQVLSKCRSRMAFRGFGRYLSLALPSTGMLCMSWWALEAMVLMAGMMPRPNLNVALMGIALNTSSAQYCLSRGMAGDCLPLECRSSQTFWLLNLCAPVREADLLMPKSCNFGWLMHLS